MKPGAELFEDVLPALGGAANVDAATIMRAVQARAIACLPGADDWPESARDALRELRGLAGRSDASAVFEAGRLVQRIADAWPVVRFTFDDGTTARVSQSDIDRTNARQLADLVRLKREAVAANSEIAAGVSSRKRARKADKRRDKVVAMARELLDAGREPRTLAALIEKQMNGKLTASTIRRYLNDSGIKIKRA